MNDLRNDDIENARVGYQAALSYAASEKQLVWIRSSGMIVANSIIIAVLGSLFNTVMKGEASEPQILVISMLGLSLIGALICVLWMKSAEYTTRMAKYYVWSARRLEEKYLSPVVVTLKSGGALTESRKEDGKVIACIKKVFAKEIDFMKTKFKNKSNEKYGEVTFYTATGSTKIKKKGFLTVLGAGLIEPIKSLFKNKKISSAKSISAYFFILYLLISLATIAILRGWITLPKSTKQAEQKAALSNLRANERDLVEVKEKMAKYKDQVDDTLKQMTMKIEDIEKELQNASKQQNISKPEAISDQDKEL